MRKSSFAVPVLAAAAVVSAATWASAGSLPTMSPLPSVGNGITKAHTYCSGGYWYRHYCTKWGYDSYGNRYCVRWSSKHRRGGACGESGGYGGY